MVNTDIKNIKLPLGHGGALLIDNKTGRTKYYEFGRYPPGGKGMVGARRPKAAGNVRNVPVPDVVIGKNGKPTEQSLKRVYDALSKAAGQGKPVDPEYHEGASFDSMQRHVDGFANDEKRDDYSLIGNNCFSFANNVMKAGEKKSEASVDGVEVVEIRGRVDSMRNSRESRGD